MSATIDGNKIIIPLEVLLSGKQELQVLQQEIEKSKQDVSQLEERLGNIGLATVPTSGDTGSSYDTGQGGEGAESGGPTASQGRQGQRTDKRGKIFASGKIKDFKKDPFFEDSDETSIIGSAESATGKALGAASTAADIGTTGNLGGLTGLLTKYVPFLGTALMGWGIASKMIDAVYGPGGWKDTRWKRNMSNEIEGYFSRQDQQDRRIGLEGVIVSSVGGFKQMNGALVENTQREARTFGVTRIGLQDKASGWRPSS